MTAQPSFRRRPAHGFDLVVRYGGDRAAPVERADRALYAQRALRTPL